VEHGRRNLISSVVRTRLPPQERPNGAFLNQPGQADIQSDLFFDYRTNVDAYPSWQAWMRKRQPRLLVLWGRYDQSFELSEAEAYRRDVQQAEVHILDAGHFALDTAADQIAELVRTFMESEEKP
jgi:pimeloyl-ACP methyl ester carboxylesterase